MMLPVFVVHVLSTSPSSPPVVDPDPGWSMSTPYYFQDSAPPSAESKTEHKTYLRLTGGLVTTADSDGPEEDIEFDEGYLAAVALGRRIGASESGLGFALELEGVWTDQDAADQGPIQAVTDVSVLGALLNAVLDFKFADAFSIYGGAGIGPAWLDVGTESDSINDFDDEDGPFLAWQARVGAAFHFSESVAVHLGYRFLNIDDAQIDDDLGAASFELETQQHVLELGLLLGI